jgi:hypothetical protein
VHQVNKIYRKSPYVLKRLLMGKDLSRIELLPNEQKTDVNEYDLTVSYYKIKGKLDVTNVH